MIQLNYLNHLINMNRILCDKEPKSRKDFAFSNKLKEFSPIRKEEIDSKVSKVQSKNYKFCQAIETLPTRPNTSAKSFYSDFEGLDCCSIDDLENLRVKVKKLEENIHKNLNLIEEKLAKNEKLEQIMHSMEKKIKCKKNKFFDDSNINCECDSKCTIW